MEGTIYEKNVDRNVDRNADNRQRTATNIDEREAALEGAGRTAGNIQKHSWPYPPFGP